MPEEELLPENVGEYFMVEGQNYSVKCQAKPRQRLCDVHYDLRSVSLQYLGWVGHASRENKVTSYSPYHFGLSPRENMVGLRF